MDRVKQRKIVREFRSGSVAVSQRQYARVSGIPRSTLQHWVAREAPPGVDPEVAAFFETPAGVELLHRILVAAHLVMCWMGAGGVRLVCIFLTMSKLSPFIANSYGAQHGVAAELQAALVQFGATERERLAETMAHREITICEDETFLKEGICLVAVEPVSNFVVLEEFAEHRDAETWRTALERATEGIPVKVVQIASDEAKALLHHAAAVGAHHAPDLFHVQHEICQAVSLPLHHQRTRAEEKVGKATAARDERTRERDAYLSRPRRPGRPPAIDARVREAEAVLATARANAAAAELACVGWRGHMRAVGEAFQPYDPTTGARRSPEVVSADLNATFAGLRAVVRAAGLSSKAEDGIEKAARVVPKMVATIAFYETRVEERVRGLGLPPDQEDRLRNVLIPAAYLERTARRRPTAERGTLEAAAERLRTDTAVQRSADAGVETQLQRIAGLCADEFQRSSSCVEGRNGRLSQYQHALRRLNPEKQAALTVTHNYLAKRPDGSTAAERFFGSAPRDPVEFLLARIRSPARPAKAPARGRN